MICPHTYMYIYTPCIAKRGCEVGLDDGLQESITKFCLCNINDKRAGEGL